jgi:pimeloyl-ACP methyl ester carboxylesterase
LGLLPLLGLGVWLSNQLEPGVRAESISLETARGTSRPALRIRPDRQGDVPRVVLAHGFTASKETMFVLAEALAAAGFDTLAFDFPGHGESSDHLGEPPARVVADVQRAFAPNALALVGHSMGGYGAGRCLEAGQCHAPLLISLGALPDQNDSSPWRMVVGLGSLEELLSPARARADLGMSPASHRLIVAPGIDHVLEPYSTELVRAAVEEACAMAHRPVPPKPTCWLWRLLGAALLSLCGVLGIVALPRRPFAGWRGILVGVGAGSWWLFCAHLGFGHHWLNTSLVPNRLPYQLFFTCTFGATSALLGGMISRLFPSLSRTAWIAQASLFLFAMAVAVVTSLSIGGFLALAAGLGTMLIAAACTLGTLAEFRWGSLAAHATFAVLLGYVVGQWLPLGL